MTGRVYINSYDRLVNFITADADNDRHTSVNLVYDSNARRRQVGRREQNRIKMYALVNEAEVRY